MLRYFIYLPLNLICMMLCYITNPFVVLFANEVGDLPKIFKLWQTWDGSIDDEGYLTEDCPKWCRYDFYKHYKPYREPVYGNHEKRCVELINPNFTTKERILRYICRVLWLTRNCGYGFAYYIFGININAKDMKKVYGKYQQVKGEHRSLENWVKKDTNILLAPFKIKNDLVFFNNKLEFNWYMGWKVDLGLYENHRAMIANRISIRKAKFKNIL